MRRIVDAALALALLLALPGGLAAQGEDPEKLERDYQAKLQKDFATRVGWVHELAEAQEQAAEQDKLILGYFTRSYAP